jgi:NAD(P)H-dependent FMN reductase
MNILGFAATNSRQSINRALIGHATARLATDRARYTDRNRSI